MSWAARFVGKPFRDGGRGPEAYDCWGVVCGVYRDCLGVELPLYGETRATDLRGVSRAVDAGKDGAEWRRVTDPQAFDVAVMRLPSSARVGHVGVCDGQGRVLHAEAASGVALERADSAMIARRIVGYWRHETQC